MTPFCTVQQASNTGKLPHEIFKAKLDKKIAAANKKKPKRLNGTLKRDKKTREDKDKEEEDLSNCLKCTGDPNDMWMAVRREENGNEELLKKRKQMFYLITTCYNT